ncbi:MAG: hydrolase, partial [Pseudomonadota bacterium]
MNDAYEEQGFGAIQIGFGARPAVLVVDFQLGFTSADQPLGGSAMVDAAVENTARLLAAARRAQVPVLQTYVGHCCDHDALNWKIPAVRTDLMEGTEGSRLDP